MNKKSQVIIIAIVIALVLVVLLVSFMPNDYSGSHQPISKLGNISIIGKPTLVLKQNHGLEKWLIESKSWDYNSSDIFINLTINMTVYNFMKNYPNNRTKCLIAKPYILEDYPNFDCANTNHTNMLKARVGNFTTKGFKLIKKGINQGYINVSGNKVYITIPLSTLDNLDLLEIGESSLIFEYQNQSKIEYVYDWGATNITLLNEGEISSDIFVNFDNVSYKFGANDFTNLGLENYTYVLESTMPLKQRGYKLYTESPNLTINENQAYYDTQEFDFADICSRKFECGNETKFSEDLGLGEGTYEVCNYTSNCEFSNYMNNNLYVYEIDFLSDEFIDPELENGTIKIRIINATHLDSNRSFIADIFDYVKYYDNNYTDYIQIGDYVRVVFEKNLSAGNDITIVANSMGLGNIIVYEKDENQTIAEINDVGDVGVYKTYLTGLSETQDTFDLEILGDSIRFDYIVDPITVPNGYNLVNDSLNLGTFEAIHATSQFSGSFSVNRVKDSDYYASSPWATASGQTTNQNITINFTESLNFDTIEFHTMATFSASPNNTNIYVSDDSLSWTLIETFAFYGGIPPTTDYDFHTINLTSQTARYVIAEFLDNMGHGTFIELDEIRIFKNSTNLANLSTTTIHLDPPAFGSGDDQKFLADNDLDRNHDVRFTTMTNQNITFDFGSAKVFDSFEWYGAAWFTNYNSGNFTASVSDDNITWTDVLSQNFTDDLAIIEYFNFTQQTKQYFRIWIKDAYSGSFHIFSELRVFEQEVSGDNAPVVTLSFPDDDNSTEQGHVVFECNATDDFQLLNVSLYVWNKTSLVLETINSTDWNGTINSTQLSYEFTEDDDFIWNCEVFDNESQQSWGSANFTININASVSEFSRNIADVISLDKGIARLGGFKRVAIDEFSITELITRRLVSLRTAFDNILVTPLINTLGVLSRNIDDVFSLTEVVTRLRNVPRLPVDVLNINTFIDRTYSSFRTFSDSLFINEVVNRFRGLFINIDDNISITELITSRFGLIRTLVDSISISETVDRNYFALRNLSDSFSITEVINRTYFAFRNLSDLLSITEVVAKLRGVFVNIDDNLSIEEVVSRFSLFIRTISDNIFLEEGVIDPSAISKLLINIADTLSIDTFIERTTIFIRTLSDILNFFIGLISGEEVPGASSGGGRGAIPEIIDDIIEKIRDDEAVRGLIRLILFIILPCIVIGIFILLILIDVVRKKKKK